MITIDNMHQGYIFRVCSVVLLVEVLQVLLMLFILFACFTSEFRSCVKVEVAVMGSPS